MAARKPIIALMYDFDKTLCTKDMQEYTFIPKLGIKPKAFWTESGKLAKEQNMDSILAYMYLMIRKASGAQQSIHREDFVKLGKDIELFPGVIDWFSRISAFGKAQGVNIKHYIISSGLKEIIQGTSIAQYFEEIYACEFHYDENNVADWPAVAMNYTAKTQFLFRINKGVTEIYENNRLNAFTPEDERPVPFRNMIYFGDGLTDVPCMKLVKVNGGKSVAVYKHKRKVEPLIRDGRVDYIMPADYSEGKDLEELVQSIIVQMAANDKLYRKAQQQYKQVMKKDKQ